jgi:hypothetical protein
MEMYTNCHSIEDVVRLINEPFATSSTGEEVAAKYAIEGATEAGYGLGDAELSAQLDALAEAGADFDYRKALELAAPSGSSFNKMEYKIVLENDPLAVHSVGYYGDRGRKKAQDRVDSGYCGRHWGFTTDSFVVVEVKVK